VSAAADVVLHVITLEEIAWGLALIVVTMLMHALAMPATIAVCNRIERRRSRLAGFLGAVRVLLVASLLIVLAHLLEVVVWAAFFWARGALPTVSSAYYYALLQYTTVGSELSLNDRWHLLGGMIAIAGLLTFAWSTTVLLTLAQQFQDALQPPPSTGGSSTGTPGV